MNLIKVKSSPSVYNAVDSIFDNFLTSFSEPKNWSPKYNIIENEDNFIVLYEVPGLKKEEIKVKTDSKNLYVSAKNDISQQNDSYYNDFNNTCFSNKFSLPDNIKSSGIESKLENGILEIIIPKEMSVSEKMKTIKIK